jgi:CRP/FNR family transcriptional regulator
MTLISPVLEQQDRYPPFQLRGRDFAAPEGPASVVNLLTAEQQFRLQQIATLVEFKAGNSVIFAEGARCNFVYLVASGVVRISRCSQAGRRQILAFMMSGDVFGFPEDGLHVNTAKTASAAVLYRISWPQLQTILQNEPDLQARFLTRLAFDLRQAQQRILTLGQQNTLQRLASCLLDLMSRPEFYDARRKLLSFCITRFDLADYLGTSSENIIRLLSGLEKSKLIRRQATHLLEICDPAGLGRIANGHSRRRIG